MQPQPVPSPERCRGQKKAAGKPEKLNQRHQSKKKGKPSIIGRKVKINDNIQTGFKGIKYQRRRI